MRAGAYGYTLGASVGLAVVEHDEGVTAAWLAETAFEVDIAGTRVPATLPAAPLLRPRQAAHPQLRPWLRYADAVGMPVLLTGRSVVSRVSVIR